MTTAAALVATLLVVVVAPASAQEPRASLPDLEDEVMCPICGTTLELSESPQAERERVLIRRLIDRGLDKDEIKERLVAEYGEEVLAEPETDGFDLSAWLVPILGLALAALALGAFLRGSRSGPDRPAEMDEADRRRLDEELSAVDR